MIRIISNVSPSAFLSFWSAAVAALAFFPRLSACLSRPLSIFLLPSCPQGVNSPRGQSPKGSIPQGVQGVNEVSGPYRWYLTHAGGQSRHRHRQRFALFFFPFVLPICNSAYSYYRTGLVVTLFSLYGPPNRGLGVCVGSSLIFLGFPHRSWRKNGRFSFVNRKFNNKGYCVHTQYLCSGELGPTVWYVAYSSQPRDGMGLGSSRG